MSLYYASEISVVNEVIKNTKGTERSYPNNSFWHLIAGDTSYKGMYIEYVRVEGLTKHKMGFFI